MKRGKLYVALGILFALAVAALYIYIYTIPEITGAMTETSIVSYGEMKIADTVDAVIVREESVYKAERSGTASYYLENNTKTRNGIKILDIFGKNGTESVSCPVTGVVSFYVDGYESILTPGAIGNINNLMPEDWNIEAVDVQNEIVSQGDSLYKLITSETFYTVFIVSAEDGAKYSEGASVTLEFENGSVAAKISNIYPIYGEIQDTSNAAISSDVAGYAVDQTDASAESNTDSDTDETSESAIQAAIKGYIVSISTAKYYKDYDKVRTCKVAVVLRDDKGLIVPNSAIAQVDGNDGVYVKGIDGEYTFTRIKVINTDGTDSVVYADTFSVLREDGLTDTVYSISIYDEILKDASKQTSENSTGNT